jgi:hypothetical protein
MQRTWRVWRPAAVGPRTVELESPSAAEEGSWVFLTAAFICLCVIYVVAFQSFGRQATEASLGLLPYQTLFRDLPGDQQRVLRAMQEGVAEAVVARDASGDWPGVAPLAEQGIPPFAFDPLDRAKLQWAEHRGRLAVDYVGVPRDGAAPFFLIAVREPEPGGSEQPVPGVVDEEHRALADGALVHVTFWTHAPGAAPPSEIIADPALRGWTQIRIDKPTVSLEEP